MTKRLLKKIALGGCVGRYSAAQWYVARNFCSLNPKWEISIARLDQARSSTYGTNAYPRVGGRPSPNKRRNKKG
jgi:hypothetical protein